MTKNIDSDDVLTLAEVAERRGLHYMTVYRHVRTGRLRATKVDGEWQVRAADLDADPARASRGKPGAADLARRLPAFHDRLLAADEPGVWGIVENCLSGGAEPVELHHEVIIPALQQIGERWSDGELRIADEHTATAIAYRVVARLGPMMRAKGRSRGTIVIGAVAGDTHALAVSILADILRSARFNVIDLGGNTPIASFLDAIQNSDQCRAVGISASVPADDVVRETVREIRSVHPELPVIVGGESIRDETHAKMLGSAGFAAESRDIVPQFEQSIGRLSGLTTTATT
ncbi:MAG: cobalamin-dependent protein [Acidimicrobiia bacterium]|nr:cobalamin-dependent protein [Acidimicrobiia bacterium]